jgi:methyl-accepting chemotaxis protein
VNMDSDQLGAGKYTTFVRVSGGVVLAWAFFVWIGWRFDYPGLTSVLPGCKAMSPLSAVAFFFAGSGLFLWNVACPARKRVHQVAIGLGAAVVLIGLFRLLEIVFDKEWGFNALFPLQVTNMAPPTAVAFILLGFALCSMGVGTWRGISLVECFVLVPILIALLVLVGYGYRIQPLYSVSSAVPVSFPSALLIMILSAGILYSCPDRGLMGLVTLKTAAGRMVRHLMTGSMVLLFTLGWLRLEGERSGLYSSDIGFALFMMSNIVLLGMLIFRNASQLRRAEILHEVEDDTLRREHKELEGHAEERTQDLARVVAELSNGIAMLLDVARDVMTVSNQMSTGAAETATSVAQTATTFEEVRQTVRMTTHDAGQVASSALQAAQFSQEGRKSTEEAIATMQRIRDEMDAIADSMMRLNDQTQSIGQIIDAVNALAAQSNLLAVNAAIEASKAGERGKGFSIVAQEVRNLADQSRRATHQIGMILNDIQKATHLSVTAIENGRKAVERGVSQSVQTGHSIETLAASVNSAAEAASHIANANQQQLYGVDQVSVSMTNIREATTNSLSCSRQMEVAAQHLKELGQKLEQVVVQYKVP